MKILLPKNYVEIPENTPVFFLAGPVRGGDDWQQACCNLLQKQMGDTEFYVAIPYFIQVLPENHPLLLAQVIADTKHFPRQLNWERYYIDLAAKQGCLIFWLPEESKTNPRIGGGPYATDTRGEVGEWRGRMMYNKTAKVVIGGEEGFEGFDVLCRNFKFALGDTFEVGKTLEETVFQAIQKIK
jgi:hypothetical protein